MNIGYKIVGFTGSRDGMSVPQHNTFTDVLSSLVNLEEFHHGGCIGSDAQAHKLVLIRTRAEIHVHFGHLPKFRAKRLGISKFRVVCYPPEKTTLRNEKIVSVSSLLVATPAGPEKQRSGTWSTIRKTRRQNKTRYIILPNGDLTIEDEAA